MKKAVFLVGIVLLSTILIGAFATKLALELEANRLEASAPTSRLTCEPYKGQGYYECLVDTCREAELSRGISKSQVDTFCGDREGSYHAYESDGSITIKTVRLGGVKE